MRYVSHADEFYAAIEQRFGTAVRDVAQIAADLPGSPSDLRAEPTGRLTWRVGSSAPYARAQERGAYIVPKRRRALRFNDGTFRMVARLKPKRYLAKAAANFSAVVRRRMSR